MFQIFIFFYFISILILTFWFKFWNLQYILKIHLTKNKLWYPDPQLRRQCKFLKLSPWWSTQHDPLYCVLLNCLFYYPGSMAKMPPSLTLLHYPSSSLSFPPGHLWGLATEPGRGQRSLEKWSEVSEQRGNISTPPWPIGGNPWQNSAHTTLHNSHQKPRGGVIPWNLGTHAHTNPRG